MTNPIVCMDCGKDLGEMADAKKGGVSHGICKPCLKVRSPGAYRLRRVNEIQESMEAFDRAPGAEAMNHYFFNRRAA